MLYILFWKCGNNSILRGNSAVRKRPKESREIAAVKWRRRQSERRKTQTQSADENPKRLDDGGKLSTVYLYTCRCVDSKQTNKQSQGERAEREGVRLSRLFNWIGNNKPRRRERGINFCENCDRLRLSAKSHWESATSFGVCAPGSRCEHQ